MSYSPSEDHQPLFTVNGYPVYVTTLLIGIYTLSMLVIVVIGPVGFAAAAPLLMFSSHEVLHGQIWRFITYALLNPPSPGFVIDMVMLWWFGREVERFFGRKLVARFYVLMILIPPLVMLLFHQNMAGEPGGFAPFIAFATLYPGVMLIFGMISAGILAVLLVAFYTLYGLYLRSLPMLVQLWTTVGLGYGFVRWEQGRISLPSSFNFRRLLAFYKRPKLRVVRRDTDEKPVRPAAAPRAASTDELDALLDKIARSGIDSLTPAEKARLEKARQALLKKDN